MGCSETIVFCRPGAVCPSSLLSAASPLLSSPLLSTLPGFASFLSLSHILSLTALPSFSFPSLYPSTSLTSGFWLYVLLFTLPYPFILYCSLIPVILPVLHCTILVRYSAYYHQPHGLASIHTLINSTHNPFQPSCGQVSNVDRVNCFLFFLYTSSSVQPQLIMHVCVSFFSLFFFYILCTRKHDLEFSITKEIMQAFNERPLEMCLQRKLACVHLTISEPPRAMWTLRRIM